MEKNERLDNIVLKNIKKIISKYLSLSITGKIIEKNKNKKSTKKVA